VCLSVNEALSQEMGTLAPITKRMMFPEATKLVRNILESVRTGNDGWAIERIRANPDNHLQELAAQHLDHNENKDTLAKLIESTASMLPDEMRKRMRKNEIGTVERIEILHEIGTSLLLDVFASRDVSEARSTVFMRQKPMMLRYLYLKAWRCYKWLSDGGFDNRRAESVTNDDIDDQYILAATFFDGLFSLEGSANMAYQDLRRLLAKEA